MEESIRELRTRAFFDLLMHDITAPVAQIAREADEWVEQYRKVFQPDQSPDQSNDRPSPDGPK